jgi:hypothetical protein
MNWNKIATDNPHAWKALNEWHNNDSSVFIIDHPSVWADSSPLDKWEIRHLYEFLDEKHIFITIELEVQYTREIDEDGNNPHYVPDGFWYSIHDDSQLAASGLKVYKLRAEAEVDAFTDAFEILENKLT